MANEIVETERSYSASLAFACEVVITPLRWNAAHATEPILASDEIGHIFANLEQVFALSLDLLRQLEARVRAAYNVEGEGEEEEEGAAAGGAKRPGGGGGGKRAERRQIAISDIFLFSAPFLKLYKVYCANYNVACDALIRARAADSSLWRTFWEQCALHPDFKQSRLEDLLIMPVQRIPRYVLLLRDLIKSTWPEHSDWDGLHSALKMLEGIALDVNEAMASNEVSAEM